MHYVVKINGQVEGEVDDLAQAKQMAQAALPEITIEEFPAPGPPVARTGRYEYRLTEEGWTFKSP